MLVRLIAALLAFMPVALRGQAPAPVTVHIRVADSANVPIGGADVSIVDGLHDVRASGTSDATGRLTLTIPGGATQHEAIARKIGYARSSTFFVPHHDEISLALTLRRPVQQLETVKVTAREDAKRRSYHLEADDIANSSRPIFDGMDAVLKLKPDMMYGREPEFCGGAKDIWINGKLMRGVLPSPMVQARRGIPPTPFKSQSGRPPPVPKLLTGSEAVMTVLAEIKPEHIAEMSFKDCFDTTVNKVHGNSALFVVLKEGIAFELNGRGSYVKDLGDRPFVADSTVTTVAADALAYRNRLLGVYDGMTGEPVPDVAVIDSTSGTTARTTSTGTITLLFLPEGQSTLRVQKAGFQPQTISVLISPRDTLPITLVLTHAP